MRFAIVGRPNAGKSTLINRILGEERLLTGPEAGITRDSIGIDFSWHGRAMKIFDTAGLRKRANVQDKLEKLAAADAIRAVKFADVVVVLIDATIPFERQDLSIVDLVEREGRALVIGLNKWDLVAEPGKTLKTLREEADRLLPQVEGSPVVPVCGLTGAGIDKLMDAIIRTHEVWNKRIATGKLNRWLAATIDRTPPPAVSGRRIKIRYMTQPKARPPTFVLFGNQLDASADELRALPRPRFARDFRSAGRARCGSPRDRARILLRERWWPEIGRAFLLPLAGEGGRRSRSDEGLPTLRCRRIGADRAAQVRVISRRALPETSTNFFITRASRPIGSRQLL